ncbi:hypothetical protein C1878_08640 [Gordonibacter sp. 28C]|uniref:hypothetical protein n=1 Tax=Gordonibacter sp. 28C TaxID=2078569 RepID=UPI000DF75A5F|nr:hypothetical protein [Gordonibacter sp. 28C]RDB62375.1 hypothetical protein C1878_08640 [Gordonibacter sp. 28C]
MKNFEVQCPTDGTSALQPEFDRASASVGTIIEFPRRTLAIPGHIAPLNTPVHGRCAPRQSAETARGFRLGRIDGCAYGRVRPWQAAVVGCVFSALTLASMFVGL